MLYAIADTVSEIVHRINIKFTASTRVGFLLQTVNDRITQGGIWRIGLSFKP